MTAGQMIRGALKWLERSAIGIFLLKFRPIQKIAYIAKQKIPHTVKLQVPLSQEELARRNAVKSSYNREKELIRVDYSDIFVAHDDYISSKWGHYCFIYQELFSKYLEKKKPVNILEIGVQNGGSLQIWKKFLPEGSQIYGIDIEPGCRLLKFEDHIHVYQGNASDSNFWETNLQDTTFDVILDDGSHLCGDVIATFELLFSKKLNSGGTYIIEDLHTGYLWQYQGGFRDPKSSVECFKNVIDALNVNYYEKPVFFSENEYRKLQNLNKQVKKISFYDSICAIEKYNIEPNSSFEIFLTGFNSGIYIDNKFEERKIENNIEKMKKIKEYFT